MKHKPLPSIERLRHLLDYDPAEGTFRWRVSNTNKVPVGSPAGTVMNAGYVHIQIDKRLYLGHRIAWLMSRGTDPGEAQVDHKDLCRTNNRAANLRLAVEHEADNMQNLPMSKLNTSGHPGVCPTPSGKKWRAYISRGYRQINLGVFPSKDEAILARQAAKRIYHPFHTEDRT